MQVQFIVMVAGPGVRLQVGELRELLGAPRVATLVRLVASVGPDVLLEVRQLGELSLTNLAPEIKTKKVSHENFNGNTAVSGASENFDAPYFSSYRNGC